MSDFNYTVKKHDKGLSYIFLEKARKQGFSVTESNVDWAKVMSVFDEIQKQEQQQGHSLFSGGTDKSRSGWGSSYVIKRGQKIDLNESQLNEIYTAMGAKKSGEAAEATTAVVSTSAPASAECPADTAINSGNVSGTYSICTGEDGKGSRVTSEIKIEGEAEAEKFFKDLKKDEKTGEYSSRNVSTNNLCLTKAQATAEAQRLTANTAIYNDLDDKSATGAKTLSEPEKDFMAKHRQDMTNSSLALSNEGRIIDGASVKGLEVSKNTTVEAFPVHSQKGPEVTGCKEESTISSGNVSGTYAVCDGTDGAQYRLTSDLKVNGEAEAAKYYNNPVYDESTKTYSIRNIRGTEANAVWAQAQSQANGISAKAAVYKDLKVKENSGMILTDAEKAFQADYLQTLDSAGLLISDEYEILPKPAKKKILGLF